GPAAPADPDGWVAGGDVDWQRLYPNGTPQPLSLPTYPFARERYWLPTGRPTVGGGTDGAPLHALVHRNTSTLLGQRFETTLTGTEFYLTDHQVQGRPILPAVVSLEMARAAATLAGDASAGAVHLSNVTWLRPVTTTAPETVLQVLLAPDGTDTGMTFDIVSLPSPDGEPIVHVQGEATLTPQEAPRVDLAAVRAACGTTVPVDACYDALAGWGVAYGPGLRGLTELSTGDGQVLARLAVPASIQATDPAYVLHPAILDAALHAGIALHLDGQGGLALPFALDRITVFGPRPAETWAWLRTSGTTSDIDLCDADGRVWARLTGLTAHPVDGDRPTTTTAAVPAQGDVSGQVVRYVAGLLASVIRVPVERLGVDEPLDVFGVDSIVALEVVRRLEPVFGVLPKTLLFEHRSVSGLAAYFVRHHGDRLGAVIGEPPAIAATAPGRAIRRVPGGRRRTTPTGDVAIVGLAGRYPKAGTVDEFWAALRDGRDCVTGLPADRAGFAGTTGVRGGFLDGVDEFDPLFFNIAPADAELLDPQERLFLQCAYETLQDAGYTRAHAAASGPVGVFVGV
ncbi:polyketide synthase dehydratase domain-containing protein, partial [Dactylosporangium sp. NPDC049525]|uniref:polyketide synthase dehydratase domain-containing protein n=1 Tax=Dactylosporangium sp. NPDC049525 TaxID=3154730 RepID=UPI0034217557